MNSTMLMVPPPSPQFKDSIVYDGWFKSREEWKSFCSRFPSSPDSSFQVHPSMPPPLVRSQDAPQPVRASRMCVYGANCTRRVCTFAHSLSEWFPQVCKRQDVCDLECHRFHNRLETKEQYQFRLEDAESQPSSSPTLFSCISVVTKPARKSSKLASPPKVQQPVVVPQPSPVKPAAVPEPIISYKAAVQVTPVSAPSPAPAPAIKRSLPCKHASTCTYKGCTFAHSIDELDPKECGFQDQCRHQSTCKFIHSSETKDQYALRLNLFPVAPSPAPIIIRRTRMCKRASHCSYPGCTFAHTFEEFDPPACSHQDSCRNGHSCKYFHSHTETKQEFLTRTTK
jgi:hypothetical protein